MLCKSFLIIVIGRAHVSRNFFFLSPPKLLKVDCICLLFALCRSVRIESFRKSDCLLMGTFFDSNVFSSIVQFSVKKVIVVFHY